LRQVIVQSVEDKGQMLLLLPALALLAVFLLARAGLISG
jgi:hypothetical protein